MLGAGVLRILPLDFARQLTTFRSNGENPLRSLARFGGFFGESLWNVYGPAARREEARHD